MARKDEKNVEKGQEKKPKNTKYTRGIPVAYSNIKDKKLKSRIKKTENRFQDAAEKAEKLEMILPEEVGYLEAEGMEKTYNFRQEDLAKNVDINTSKKIFNLDLKDFGPYSVDYTRNGRNLLIGGKKGHIAAFDWQTGKLGFELHVKETVRDVHWLHNETLLAAAQKKYVYIYDNRGLEIHRLKNHIEVNKLDFLPYHYLLASVGNAGYLKYQDTSTGQLVAEHRTKLGACHVMAQNPYNAVMHLGHGNGTVTLWSPSMTTPLVKMLCHKGPVQALAVDRGGNYMATSGLDGQLKIWDIRKYQVVQEYYSPTPAASLSISQMGLLAVGWGPHVSIWKDAFKTKQQSPYMTHHQPSSTVHDVHFVPYDDVLGFGHAKGVSSVVVPGAGEPNFDSLEANVFQTVKQRQEMEVHSLLDKLQPHMITLDPTVVGKLDRASKEVIAKERQEEYDEANPKGPIHLRNKARGKNSSLKRYLRKKQRNVVDQRKLDAMAKLEKEKLIRIKRARGEVEEGEKPFTALDIFAGKKAKIN
ncbi:WD40-repeat-containing domain protein [Umbelopsis sp. PMI_123]|nr:WD40-repeat-containing domain protein [Umbelopsis sp. PMI_123]